MLRIKLLISCALLILSNQGVAKNLAILYPEIREPYRQVFLNIAGGVSSKYEGRITLFNLKKGETADSINKRLKEHDIESVVTLGRRGLNMVNSLPPEMPKAVVVGGVVVHPNGHALSGISLSPSPERLLTTLRALQPKVQRVYVIYQQGSGEWLIAHAKEASRSLGLTLNVFPTHDIREQASEYRKLLRDLDPRTDALWVSHDSSRIDKSIMNMVLEISWRRKLTVFSSNLVDMKRGVLFSLYPDNHAMGISLANMLMTLEKTQQSTLGILPVSNVLTAVNLRTASHLGLHFNKRQRSEFGMVYPPQ